MGRGLRIIQAINIGLCLLGALVFGALLYYVQTRPNDFERRTKDLVRERVETELAERLTPAGAERIKAAAAQLSDQLKQKIDQEEGEMRQSLSHFVAVVVAAICRADCGDQVRIEASVDRNLEKILARLGIDDATLRRMVEDRYESIRTKLRRDVTIFLFCNFIVMAAALSVSLFRGRAARRLLPIAVALTVSTALASYWYVFGQSWVLTIIFSDFMGWSYLVLLLLFFLMLVDIAVNRARIVNALLLGLNAAFSR